MICWRNIPGRKELARVGEGGRARTSCGWQWFAAWYQKLWSKTYSPCLCPAVQTLALLPSPSWSPGWMSVTCSVESYPQRRSGSRHVLLLGMGAPGLWGSGPHWGLKFLCFLASKHLCHVSVTQSMMWDIWQKPGLDKTGTAVIQEGSASLSPMEDLTQSCGRMARGLQSSLCVSFLRPELSTWAFERLGHNVTTLAKQRMGKCYFQKHARS